MTWSPFEGNTEMSQNNNSYSNNHCNTIFYFDPNDKKYRCCCNQSHATTGVRIIAGMLCVTVLLEVWHLAWFWISDSGTKDAVLSSTFQLLIGLSIAGTVMCALWKESAAYLLPYLLLQTIGLGAVCVILIALVYVTLTNDKETIHAFMESHGPKKVVEEVPQEGSQYLTYFGWTMVGSCLVLLALQLWLISIVFACWRYFRDKHNYGFSKGYTSSFVILRPSRRELAKDHLEDERRRFRPILRSMSADEINSGHKFKEERHRAKLYGQRTMSSASFDCTTSTPSYY
uniref:Uncharacterized protein n=1 Tax=Ditylenchus dipsaci TaxID=166011 RepID=A0A915DFT2_9BILA